MDIKNGFLVFSIFTFMWFGYVRDLNADTLSGPTQAYTNKTITLVWQATNLHSDGYLSSRYPTANCQEYEVFVNGVSWSVASPSSTSHSISGLSIGAYSIVVKRNCYLDSSPYLVTLDVGTHSLNVTEEPKPTPIPHGEGPSVGQPDSQVWISINSNISESLVQWDFSYFNPNVADPLVKIELTHEGPDIWNIDKIIKESFDIKGEVTFQLSNSLFDWQYDSYYIKVTFCAKDRACQVRDAWLYLHDYGFTKPDNAYTKANSSRIPLKRTKTANLTDIRFVHQDLLGSPVAETAH
ncbi:hypothetical protein [Catenovulum agarivorans]|nr:hypothetical protein [Catenovulum agarivorans]